MFYPSELRFYVEDWLPLFSLWCRAQAPVVQETALALLGLMSQHGDDVVPGVRVHCSEHWIRSFPVFDPAGVEHRIVYALVHQAGRDVILVLDGATGGSGDVDTHREDWIQRLEIWRTDPDLFTFGTGSDDDG